jgi:flagellin-like protein
VSEPSTVNGTQTRRSEDGNGRRSADGDGRGFEDRSDRAQTNVVGVVLLVGVVVISVGTAGIVVFDDATREVDDRVVDVRGAVTTGGVTLVHNGGDVLRTETLTLSVSVNGSPQRTGVSDGALTGSDPARFEPGERWVNDSLSFHERSVVEVMLVDDLTGTVLFETRQHPRDSPLAVGAGSPTPDPATPVPNRPPDATMSASDTTVQTAVTVSFTDASTDADGTIETVEWAFGDGDTSTDDDPTHAYDDDGTYTVSLTVTDDDGATDTTTTSISVSNRPPVAAAEADPTSAVVGEPIQFTNASFDNDGTIETVQWEFGDGDTSTDDDPTHAYDAPGTYEASLTVTDDDGATSADTVQVQVAENEPPEAVVQTDRWYLVWWSWYGGAWEQRQANLSASRSSDPDGSDTRLEYRWEIQIVDRFWEYNTTGDTLTRDDLQLGSRASQETSLRLLTDPGGQNGYEVTIRLTVTDVGGETDVEYQTISVYA